MRVSDSHDIPRGTGHRPVRGLQAVPAEQELPRHEPAFPGMSLLVDPELFCGLVRAHAGSADPGPGRLVELRYRPGVECVATYALGTGADETWVYARATPAGEPVPAASESGPETPLGFCRASWPEYGLVVRAFPCDDGLPGLDALGRPDQRAQLLAEVAPGLELTDPSIRTVSWTPERRWLGAIDDGGRPRAALRVHSPETFPRARWSAESLHDGEGLRLPRFLGHCRDRCATAVEWVPGRPLDQALFDPALHRIELEGVGAALAELHAQEPAQLPHHPTALVAPEVRALAATLGFVLPRSAPRARTLSDRLVRRLVETSDVEQPIHGWPAPEKLLLQGGGRVVVLDLDRACQGSPARDLGCLIGHLERAAAVGELSAEQAGRASEAVLEGYHRTSIRSLRRRDLTLNVAVTLFHLALWPFRRLQPDWPERTLALLERAETVLARPL